MSREAPEKQPCAMGVSAIAAAPALNSLLAINYIPA